MQSSQKSIHHAGSQASSQASPHNQLLGTSSSSYQFPLQALGQGLTSSQHPSKDQSRAKIMMQRNQTGSGASPLGHNAQKSLNSLQAQVAAPQGTSINEN